MKNGARALKAKDRTRSHLSAAIGAITAVILIASGSLSVPAFAIDETPPQESQAAEVILAPVPLVPSEASVGEVLVVLDGSASDFTPAVDMVTYQWLRDGAPIWGANLSEYAVVADDLGTALSVRISGHKEGYATVEATSLQTSPVQHGTMAPGAPVILGNAAVGEVLQVDTGVWHSGTTLTFQWFANRVLIPDAFDFEYQARAEDIGKAITVTVTAYRDGYYTSSSTSSDTAPVAPATMQTSTPLISGTPKVGSTLTVDARIWSSGTVFTYQWYRNGLAIPKATASSYKLQPADARSKISVKVTGRLIGYKTSSALSVASSTIAYGTLKAATPQLSGSIKSGSTLTAKTGSWTAGTLFKYQWYRDGRTITGAKSSKYKLKNSDVGTHITVKVTGSLFGYSSVSKTTATKTIWTLVTAKPKISGTAKVGSSLKVARGTWTAGTKFQYQWYRNGSAIAGAASSSYKLKASDAGKKISVRVSGKKLRFNSASRLSSNTSTVAKGTLKSATPSVIGKMAAGSTIRAQSGTWTSGTTFSYQWYRNGIAISGAKSATYTLRAADAQKQISVRVKGSKSGYATATKSAASRYVTITMGQRNAIGSARNYLDFISFSRSGLISQLKYERYSTAEATFAVDYISPNWNKQAARKAREYLDFMSFSREGLIRQLEFEGFTRSQALYGVRSVGY